jgi:hypothetical protein
MILRLTEAQAQALIAWLPEPGQDPNIDAVLSQLTEQLLERPLSSIELAACQQLVDELFRNF